jgi:broad specificity phosphatase PhoE
MAVEPVKKPVVFRALAGAALVAVLVAGPRARAAPDEAAVWAALQRGTHVILIRHAQTTAGVGDPPGFKLDDCSTQRNLSDEGRAQARKLGETFRTRRIEVDRVLSSPWCRCIETAELAFARKPQVAAPLASFFGEPEKRDPQVAELRKLVSDYRGPGNLVLVTHGNSITALTGLTADMGSLVVVKPEGSGKFSIVGQAGLR